MKFGKLLLDLTALLMIAAVVVLLIQQIVR